MFTPAQYRAMAALKVAEAARERSKRNSLVALAQDWLLFASRLKRSLLFDTDQKTFKNRRAGAGPLRQ
jgi:hypothetical protein